MCYKPSRNAVSLAKSATECAKKGNTALANQMLNAAVAAGRTVMNIQYTDGKRVGDHIADAREEIRKAVKKG